MHSLLGHLTIVLTLTACTQLSNHDSVRADAGESVQQKAEQQKQYDTWFHTLTPEQRAREFQRQHERALSP